MSQDLISYYNERAGEYDKVYQIPQEQEDLQQASALFQQIFHQKTVIEIACGTGYWTEQIAKNATSILATDINEAVMDIARTRQYKGNVTFELADMNHFSIAQQFDGLFGGFIWSHIPLQDIDNLFSQLLPSIAAKGDIVLIDSRPVAGTNHDNRRVTRVDQYGNTFQTRQLENGRTYEVLKNFPTDEFLIEKLSQFATDVEVIHLEHYWVATCKLK
jgi:ubiquinone/menaquinone biosynthesis C-methylase UbiE